MIHLSAEGFSAPWLDNFWTWALREFPGAVAVAGEGAPIPSPLPPVGDEDVVLHYAALGQAKRPDRSVALCWELYPEMLRYLGPAPYITDKIKLMLTAAATSAWRTVSTPLAIPDFHQCGSVDVLPIGVDTDLMRPRQDRYELREKYSIPQGKRVGFWSGTLHPMKGFEVLRQYAKDHPDLWWVLVWKWPTEPRTAGRISGCVERRQPIDIAATERACIPQEEMAELMAASDFLACPGMLRPFYLVEWEAMAAGLEPVIMGNPVKDFVPSGDPRGDVFSHGWDRHAAKRTWLDYLASL